jgi:CheY-like chemotaxis protein
MEIIQAAGCVNHVQVAETGIEALDYLTSTGRFISGGEVFPPPDLIFLDINMPGMDGWEFLQAYKKLNLEHQGKVIVMLTTSLNPDDEVKARAMDEIAAYMTKPLTKEMLEDILQQYFRKN